MAQEGLDWPNLDAIWISHFHLDHVIGLPFFEPCYAPGHRFCLWAGSVAPADNSLQRVFSTLMSPQLFPVGIEEFRAKIEFREFRTGLDAYFNRLEKK